MTVSAFATSHAGVHQFHSGSAYGDAVTNGMLLLQEHFRALGILSDIFVEHLDARLSDRLQPFENLQALGAEDVLIIHHSMGHDRLQSIMDLKCRKVLAYHNVTPAHFFTPGSVFHRYSILGRDMLASFLGKVEAVIADSDYNAMELRALGFQDVTILPVLVDDRKFADIELPQAQSDALGRPWTILFVGRICENKGHLDLVAVAADMVRTFAAPFRFHCVGSFDPSDPYYLLLLAKIRDARLENNFHLAGKISDADLAQAYLHADCYLSLSSHEGFGVPLIESMFCNLPVVALDRSCVGETLGGCGILLADSKPETVVAALEKLLLDRPFRRSLLVEQRQRAMNFKWTPIHFRVSALLWRLGVEHQQPVLQFDAPSAPLHWRVEGPFDSTYSLAILNRKLAIALDREQPGRVGLFSTEGPGDFAPDWSRIDDAPVTVRSMEGLGKAAVRPAVVIRDLYPHRVRDARGEMNAALFAWEESSVPHRIVEDFNMSLDAVLTLSDFVSNALRTSGCRVPTYTVGVGVDHLTGVKAERLGDDLGQGFRFLNVSSGFPRKGVDVLLEAFCRSFTNEDDVTLVIKSFSNPHNETRQDVLERQKDPSCPRIVLIERDMSPGELVTLYRSCNAYVSPSRGEGFGIPIAEAMLAGLPVVVTGWGGHMQFCSSETALLIDYRLERSGSHLAAVDALWASPDVHSLAAHLRLLASGQDPGVVERVAKARERLLANFRWQHVAQRTVRAMASVGAAVSGGARPIRLGWVTTWNERCGIANYSKFLIERLSPHAFVTTVFGKIGTSSDDGSVAYVSAWNAPPAPFEPLEESLLRSGVDCVVLQFNFGYFDVPALSRTIEVLASRGVPTIVMFHSTKDVVRTNMHLSLLNGLVGLKKAAALLVHSREDLRRMQDFGFKENASIFPQGVINRNRTDRSVRRQILGIPEDAFIVATFGFMLPHKGLLEMCDAVRMVNEGGDRMHWFAVNALYPIQESNDLAGRLVEQVARFGLEDRIRIFTDFLEDEVALSILESSDVIIFPYQDTAESSSAAVRYGLSSGRPVAVTPLAIFDDVEGLVIRLSGLDATAIAEDLRKMMLSPVESDTVMQAQQRFMDAADWRVLARRLGAIITTKVREATAANSPTAESIGASLEQAA